MLLPGRTVILYQKLSFQESSHLMEIFQIIVKFEKKNY